MGRAISDNGTHIGIALLAREWDGLYQTMELTLASLCSPGKPASLSTWKTSDMDREPLLSLSAWSKDTFSCLSCSSSHLSSAADILVT
ncbi:hypothetical protein RRG08_011545 [Elysia crispata]|uniref:Uncharacterized protein n=1 Tax=Elysia crispata TaxID=231223 RepID=A0AAE1APY8_9GAST|nr:hypothetical protein RRG08_011545 [Elysia crispata]